MDEKVWTEVDNYIADLFIPPDDTLTETLASSKAAGLPPIHVAPPQGKLLNLLARAMGARRILEIGTLGGYSTIWLGRALPDDGHLISLEASAHHAQVAHANLQRAGLDKIVEIRVGGALETLPQLVTDGQGPFDLIFIDADKPGYADYLTWALKLSRPGGLIIADNVVRRGAVRDASNSDANVQGIRRFNELAAADPRLDITAIQTVGSKGYDGLLIALVVGQ